MQAAILIGPSKDLRPCKPEHGVTLEQLSAFRGWPLLEPSSKPLIIGRQGAILSAVPVPIVTAHKR